MDVIIQSLGETIRFVIPILTLIFIGLFGAEILVQLGFLRRLEFIGRPLVRVAHLPPESAISFVTAFGSVATANAMLAEFHREKRINDKEAILASILNSTPIYIKEVFTYQLPVIMPALGFRVGLFYLLTFWLSGMAKLIFIILGGRLTLKKRKVIVRKGDKKKIRFGDAIFNAFHRQRKIFLRIASIFVIMSFLVFVFTNLGTLHLIENYISPIATNHFHLPGVVVFPLTTYIVSPLVGIPLIGSLIHSNKITEHDAIITILLGSLVMLPILTLRFYLPHYTAIFGFRLGATILFISMGITMLVRAVLLLIFV